MREMWNGLPPVNELQLVPKKDWLTDENFNRHFELIKIVLENHDIEFPQKFMTILDSGVTDKRIHTAIAKIGQELMPSLWTIARGGTVMNRMSVYLGAGLVPAVVFYLGINLLMKAREVKQLGTNFRKGPTFAVLFLTCFVAGYIFGQEGVDYLSGISSLMLIFSIFYYYRAKGQAVDKVRGNLK
jgi:hypothetical protein